jgi:hypothetical protein
MNLWENKHKNQILVMSFIIFSPLEKRLIAQKARSEKKNSLVIG